MLPLINLCTSWCWNLLIFPVPLITPSASRTQPCMYVLCAFNLKVSRFPDTNGCIDGRYISISCPAGKVRYVYISRQHCLSLTLYSICDKKRFLDVSTGTPSKMYDSRIFRRSRVVSVLPQLCSSVQPIVGDAAYPFKEPHDTYSGLRKPGL